MFAEILNRLNDGSTKHQREQGNCGQPSKFLLTIRSFSHIQLSPWVSCQQVLPQQCTLTNTVQPSQAFGARSPSIELFRSKKPLSSTWLSLLDCSVLVDRRVHDAQPLQYLHLLVGLNERSSAITFFLSCHTCRMVREIYDIVAKLLGYEENLIFLVHAEQGFLRQPPGRVSNIRQDLEQDLIQGLWLISACYTICIHTQRLSL